MVDELAVILVGPVLPSDTNDAGGVAQLIVRVRHVKGWQQFSKRQIASAAKNDDVLHVVHLNHILFQENVFVWEKLGMQRQQRAAQCTGMSTDFAGQHGWCHHAVKPVLLHGLLRVFA